MRRSARNRIALTFILLMALVFVAISLFQHVFLNSFYLREKQKALANSYGMLAEVREPENVPESFTRYCAAEGLIYCVTDATMTRWNTNAANGDFMASKLLGIVLGKEDDYTEILQKTESYTIFRNEDRFSGVPALELWGILPGGSYYLVTCPLQSMTEAARISNKYNFYLVLGAMAIGALVMWLVSGKLEKDLERLRGETERLQRDIEEKEKIDAMRRDFLIGVSHELKTPLALIRGYAEGLRDNVNEDEAQRTYYSEVILDEADKMNRLVRQISDLHELEFGKNALEIERFDLTALIRGVVDTMRSAIDEAGAMVRLEPDAPCFVQGDAFRIEEVVTNYLTNAIHHVMGTKRIEISLEDRGDTVLVRIYNEGNPIPEGELERIWEKFYKVDKARTRAYGGSGIGLSIVKAIMDAHGQTCGVENYADGVAFTFTLTKSE